jgi:hypothetical protein
VVGIELSPEMIQAAGGGFDGAYVNLGARDRRIFPGWAPPWPRLSARARRSSSACRILALPNVIRRTLTGVGEQRRRRDVHFAEGPPAVATPSEARTALGPAVRMDGLLRARRARARPAQGQWAADHPQTFGVLAALERGVRRWPGLRQLGDASVLEGRRREPA